MNETIAPTILQKKNTDLTVGDTLVINGVAIAILAGVPLAIMGVVHLKNRVVTFRKNRKSKKLVVVTTTPEVEEEK